MTPVTSQDINRPETGNEIFVIIEMVLNYSGSEKNIK
jgi:hypothetical protein